MCQLLRKIHASFHDSEIIWWARIQVFFGSLYLVLQTVNLAPLIGDPKYVTYYMIANGLLSEWLRRRRTDEDLNPTYEGKE